MGLNTQTDDGLLAEILMQFDSPLVILDRAGRVVRMNQAAELMTGAPVEKDGEVLFADIFDLDEESCLKLCPEIKAGDTLAGDLGWQEVVCSSRTSHRPTLRVRRKLLRTAGGFEGSALVIESMGPWEQRYRDVLAGSPVVFFETLEDGKIVYGGSQLAGVLGGTEADFDGRSFFDLVDPAMIEGVRAVWDRVLDGRSVRGREFALVATGKSGRPFWFSFFPVLGMNGRVAGVRGTASDLAEQKSLAYALEAAEERFNVLFRESSDPILILSMGGEILSANPAFERISSVRSDELFCSEKGWSDFVEEEDIPLIQESIRACVETGTDDVVEYRIKTADNQTLWFEQGHSILHDEHGRSRGIMAVARDVDRRKQQELQLMARAQEMQQRHQRAQALVSRLKTLFTRIGELPSDIDGFINGVCEILFDMYHPLRVSVYALNKKTHMYEAGARLPATLLDEAGQPEFSMMSRHVMESSLPLYSNSLEKGEPYAEDHVVRELKLKTYLGAPLRDSTGKMRGTLSIVDSEMRSFDSLDVELITVAALHVAARLRAEEHEDVRRELEEHLRQAQKMEAVGTLAGGIAHDFNNILSGILGFSSFLLSKTDEDTDLYRNLELIEQSAVRAADLTRQLLAFSRRKHFAKQPFSVNKVVGEVLSILERSLAKSIVIREDCVEDLPNMLGDPGQLNQVIMNLCLNAADAMNARGGTLRLKTAHRLLTSREKQVLVDAGPGEYVCITVSDTGHGMSAAVQDHLFDPFFTTKGDCGGTGLGLSIVYGIVKNHEGDITVESSEGKGTVFKLYFPVYHGTIEKKERPAALQLRGSETILVVDDEMIVRQMVTAVLKEYGYKVIAAASGHEAAETLKEMKGRIHMALLDMVMPGMDGEATFHALKKVEPELPILLTSGFAAEDRSNRLLAAGAKGMVHKPYKSRDLVARIREVLSESVWQADGKQ